MRHRRTGRAGSAWRFAWPAALLLVGFSFLVHRQHGTAAAVERAVAIHRMLGVVLIVAGGLRWLDVRRTANRLLALSWPLLLLVAAVLLLVYEEPEGAYHGEEPVHHAVPGPGR